MSDNSKVVTARLADGRLVRVEARTNTSAERDVSPLSPLEFEEVAQSVESIASSLTAALEKVKPDKATLEFGVDIAVEAGALTALLVKGSGTATLTITLEWGQG